MPEKIFTIPINEAFDERDGCPLCRMRDKLEEQTLESALGAAMMEPSVRIEMNKEGFCSPHLQSMYRKKNKLALGLILESRLDELTGMLEGPAGRGKRGIFGKKEDKGDAAEALTEQSKSCYACKRIRSTEYRYCSNTAWLWESDQPFREKLKAQPWFCLSHGAMLLRVAKEELKDGAYSSLYEAVTERMRSALTQLRQDVTAFTVSFDHRNAGKPLSEAERSSLERATKMLR
jgi:hypothetical protein